MADMYAGGSKFFDEASGQYTDGRSSGKGIPTVANQPSPNPENRKRIDAFKIADPQYILSTDPAATIEEMQNTLWQGIGGHEIISLARRDLVDGKNINYALISDLQQLFTEYNPKTIASIENASPLYFNSFGITFDSYLPSEADLAKIDPLLQNPVTIGANNNITIYVSNIEDSYEIEVESLTSEKIFRDTIYEEGES
jgi:hypothetical protein